MNKDRKHWYGPLYLLEGFMFATGVYHKSFILTMASGVGAVVTTVSDLNSRRLDIRDAKKSVKELYTGDEK